MTDGTKASLGKRVPCFAAIVVTYNQKAFVASAVRSLIDQEVPLHIVVCDDRSTDGTSDILHALIEEATRTGRPHRLTLVEQERNLGPAANWMSGFSVTDAEWIVHCDGDDVSTPHRIQAVAMAIERNPGVNAVVSSYERIDEFGSSLGTMHYTPGTYTAIDQLLGKLPPLLGCSLAIHRNAIEDIGPLNHRLWGIDASLIRRALLLGPIAVIDEPLVRYRTHQDNIGLRFKPTLHSFEAACDWLSGLTPHTVGFLDEARKIVRYAQHHLEAGAAEHRMALDIYSDSRARTRLCLVARNHSRAEMIRAALENMRLGRATGLSFKLLRLAMWS